MARKLSGFLQEVSCKLFRGCRLVLAEIDLANSYLELTNFSCGKISTQILLLVKAAGAAEKDVNELSDDERRRQR